MGVARDVTQSQNLEVQLDNHLVKDIQHMNCDLRCNTALD